MCQKKPKKAVKLLIQCKQCSSAQPTCLLQPGLVWTPLMHDNALQVSDERESTATMIINYVLYYGYTAADSAMPAQGGPS